MAHGITLKLRAIQPAAPTSLSTRIIGPGAFARVVSTTLTGPSRDRSLPGKARRRARKAAKAGGAPMSATTPTVACDQCTGRLIYRVRFEDFPAASDNFDQLSDHRPAVFTSQQWLTTVAEHREGKVTVWRLADADQGGDFAEDVVIAYAGPHPNGSGERMRMTDLSGHGFYAELVEAVSA